MPYTPHKSHLFSLTGYSLCGYCDQFGLLTSCDLVKDLGVFFCKGLKWKFQIDNVVSKAMRVLHCLFSSILCWDLFVWIRLFWTFVLPLIEYCGPVWSPFLKRDIAKIESV
ncbi:unnamed protein product [Haemonchus placei]|uniref:Ovule protein n=1 Tax=Haemonchus placei TaxID=6290 RepID=A0A0N4X4G7_HAEPC|nr:unnamed protein product [Haemonchus placei]